MFKKFLEKKGFTAETFKALEAEKQADLQNEYLGSLESSLSEKATMDQVKEELKGLVSKEQFEKLDSDLDALSKLVNNLSEKKAEHKQSLKAALKAQIEKNNKLPDAQKRIDLVIKADNIFNISVIDGGTFDEDEANMDALLLNESAIETGFAPDLRRELTVLNEMRNATPLRIGDALKWIVPFDENGKPLTVKEANQKPIGTVKYKRESKESTKIAIYFQITEEFVNRADFLMVAVNNHFRDLVTEELEEKAFDATDGILSYGTAYVNPAGYAVPDPTKLDAINAVATSMKLRKYRPSHVVLNSGDIAMMFADKGLDGQYRLANGQSVALIDGGSTLVIGTTRLRVIEVNGDLLGIDDFVVIDWSKLKYGLGTVRLKSDPYTNMRDNILNYLMEAPFCVARPSNYPYAVVVTKFSTVEAEITPSLT